MQLTKIIEIYNNRLRRIGHTALLSKNHQERIRAYFCWLISTNPTKKEIAQSFKHDFDLYKKGMNNIYYTKKYEYAPFNKVGGIK